MMGKGALPAPFRRGVHAFTRPPPRGAGRGLDRCAPGVSARLFAVHALALRTASRARVRQRRSWPPCRGRAGAGAAPVALWRPFFANAVVALGRLPSSAPVALYYNPLLDVAVATLWEKQDGGLATPQHLREAFP